MCKPCGCVFRGRILAGLSRRDLDLALVVHDACMTDDEEYLAGRRRVDERTYLVGSLDPEIAPRMAPAAQAMRALLAEARPGERITQAALVARGARSSDLAVRTIENLISRLVRAGFIAQYGASTRPGRHTRGDARSYRLVEWPESR